MYSSFRYFFAGLAAAKLAAYDILVGGENVIELECLAPRDIALEGFCASLFWLFGTQKYLCFMCGPQVQESSGIATDPCHFHV